MKKHFYFISNIKKIYTMIWRSGVRRSSARSRSAKSGRSALAFVTERQTLERWASLLTIITASNEMNSEWHLLLYF